MGIIKTIADNVTNVCVFVFVRERRGEGKREQENMYVHCYKARKNSLLDTYTANLSNCYFYFNDYMWVILDTLSAFLFLI